MQTDRLISSVPSQEVKVAFCKTGLMTTQMAMPRFILIWRDVCDSKTKSICWYSFVFVGTRPANNCTKNWALKISFLVHFEGINKIYEGLTL